MPTCDGEIEIDECIFNISEESPLTPDKIKTKNEKIKKSSKQHTPSNFRTYGLNKKAKSKKFRIKAIETKSVSFQFD